jgi:ubiquinone/menaquinone biosynthesis C-methylase UbiE
MEGAENEIHNVIKWLQIAKDDFILDMCCGAGRHSIALAKEQFHVVGLDLSKTLLTKAQQDAGGLLVPFVLGDMRALPFTDSCFNIVLNLFTSFGYFSTDEENQRVLFEITRVLKPGGRFILDYMNPDRIKKNLIPFSKRDEAGMRVTEERYIENEFVCKNICIQNEKGERHYHERVKLYTLEQMEKMMEGANLTISQMYGNFAGEAFNSGSERMILIGKGGK